MIFKRSLIVRNTFILRRGFSEQDGDDAVGDDYRITGDTMRFVSRCGKSVEIDFVKFLMNQTGVIDQI